MIAATLISVLGLPHGALDPFVAFRLGLWDNTRSLCLFLISYIAIAAAMIALWLWMPIIGFTIFFIISIVHFGRDYQRYKKNLWQQIAYGAYVLGLPALFHPQATQDIFNYLLFDRTPDAVMMGIKLMGGFGAVVLVTQLTQHQTTAVIELITLCLLAWLLEPMWYFVVFFCVMHSPRHLWPLYNQFALNQRKQVVLVIALITAITILLGFATAFVFQSAAINVDRLILQIIFIGLAGLTLPHMILIEWSKSQSIQSLDPLNNKTL